MLVWSHSPSHSARQSSRFARTKKILKINGMRRWKNLRAEALLARVKTPAPGSWCRPNQSKSQPHAGMCRTTAS
jgi:hypothetical protein